MLRMRCCAVSENDPAVSFTDSTKGVKVGKEQVLSEFLIRKLWQTDHLNLY